MVLCHQRRVPRFARLEELTNLKPLHVARLCLTFLRADIASVLGLMSRRHWPTSGQLAGLDRWLWRDADANAAKRFADQVWILGMHRVRVFRVA